MSYSLHELQIEGITVLTVLGCRIRGCIGEHASLILRADVPEPFSDHNVGGIAVYAVRAKERKLLFNGIAVQTKITAGSGVKSIEIVAKSYSHQLDTEKHSRSFQDTTMPYSALIKTVLGRYPGIDYRIAASDRAIGDLIIQYEETDWQFLKRVLSMLETTLTPASGAHGNCLYAGFPALGNKKISYTLLQAEKDLDTFYYLKYNDQQVYDSDYINYTIRTTEVLGIFENIMLGGQPFAIKSFCYEFYGSELIATYQAGSTAGMKQKHRYPMHLIGAALGGKVTAAQQDKVQVQMDIDGGSGQPVYWFPYSTVSASPDGSGWYCMPENGDEVRIYFPSKYTKEAIALSAVSTYGGEGGSDKMSDPSSKYLSTRHGKELLLSPDSIRLNSNNQASVTISSDGKIQVSSVKSVQLYAQDSILLAAENDLEIHAAEGVTVQAGAGAMMALNEGMAIFTGTEVDID